MNKKKKDGYVFENGVWYMTTDNGEKVPVKSDIPPGWEKGPSAPSGHQAPSSAPATPMSAPAAAPAGGGGMGASGGGAKGHINGERIITAIMSQFVLDKGKTVKVNDQPFRLEKNTPVIGVPEDYDISNKAIDDDSKSYDDGFPITPQNIPVEYLQNMQYIPNKSLHSLLVPGTNPAIGTR
jgi:hypothetical protein